MKTDEEIIKESITYANSNKKTIAKVLTDKTKFPPEESPISVFMAGSPGAGKTETSRRLLEETSDELSDQAIRIDPDEYRTYFSGYTGNNSPLFQSAVSIIAEKVHDFALENKQSFIFDGTLSKVDKAKNNIERSLSRKRDVAIIYVYQDPLQAWNFVKERAEVDGRVIPKEEFIEQYFSARNTVNTLKKEFKSDIIVFLVIKNIDGSSQGFHANIDIIDNYIKEKYSFEDLNVMLV